MPRKKQVDAGKLIKAVESGTPSKQIMEKFGLKTSPQLKTAYLDALIEMGIAPAIMKSRKGREKAEDSSKQIKVNKRGSLVVPRDFVEEYGFSIGEAFTVRKTRAGVILKKH